MIHIGDYRLSVQLAIYVIFNILILYGLFLNFRMLRDLKRYNKALDAEEELLPELRRGEGLRVSATILAVLILAFLIYLTD